MKGGELEAEDVGAAPHPFFGDAYAEMMRDFA